MPGRAGDRGHRATALTDRYRGRLACYGVAALVGSAVGATLAWRTDAWVDSNPLVD